MSGIWYLAFTILAVVAIGLLVERLYREIFVFEGIRLGERLHTALYDRWAGTYDAGKSKVQKNGRAGLGRSSRRTTRTHWTANTPDAHRP